MLPVKLDLLKFAGLRFGIFSPDHTNSGTNGDMNMREQQREFNRDVYEEKTWTYAKSEEAGKLKFIHTCNYNLTPGELTSPLNLPGIISEN